MPVIREENPGREEKAQKEPQSLKIRDSALRARRSRTTRAKHANSDSSSRPRCGSNRQVTKKNRSNKTKRRKQDMTRDYTPYGPGRAAESQRTRLCGTGCGPRFFRTNNRGPQERRSALPVRRDKHLDSAYCAFQDNLSKLGE
jgi:hypothetical protein